ncbi:hypothetical protein VTJ49DRAFT_2011 [Mycothermus thermophilus]|uniref:Uncharacterized protein n=1 Tax=Humicola insolens TaxID=85995 RepID=A0ABR3VC64_HUMIN
MDIDPNDINNFLRGLPKKKHHILSGLHSAASHRATRATAEGNSSEDDVMYNSDDERVVLSHVEDASGGDAPSEYTAYSASASTVLTRSTAVFSGNGSRVETSTCYSVPVSHPGGPVGPVEDFSFFTQHPDSSAPVHDQDSDQDAYSAYAGETGQYPYQYQYQHDPQAYHSDDDDGSEPVLWCEFSQTLNCPRTFPMTDVAGWIRHHEVDHLRSRPPGHVICWFCDEHSFTSPFHDSSSKNTRSSKPKPKPKPKPKKPIDSKAKKQAASANFAARMHHILTHIHYGATPGTMRPDASVVKRLRKLEVIDEARYQELRTYSEVPAQFVHPDARPRLAGSAAGAAGGLSALAEEGDGRQSSPEEYQRFQRELRERRRRERDEENRRRGERRRW